RRGGARGALRHRRRRGAGGRRRGGGCLRALALRARQVRRRRDRRLRRGPHGVPGADRLDSPLDRHVLLVGLLGARELSIGAQAAKKIGRAFVDLDREIEARAGDTIPVIFESWGETAFREIEEEAALEGLSSREPTVIALGGGALAAESTRQLLRERAITV